MHWKTSFSKVAQRWDPAPCSQSLPHHRRSQRTPEFSGSISALRRRKGGDGAPSKRLLCVLCQAQPASPWVAGERAPGLWNKQVPALRAPEICSSHLEASPGPRGHEAAFKAAFVLSAEPDSALCLCPGTHAPCCGAEPGLAPPSSDPNLTSPFPWDTPFWTFVQHLHLSSPNSFFPALSLRPRRWALVVSSFSTH